MIAGCGDAAILSAWVLRGLNKASGVCTLSCLLLIAAVAAPAGPAVYKCATGGAVVYQSEPCIGRELKRWRATPEAVDAAELARLEVLREQLRQGPRGRNGTATRNLRRQAVAPRPQDVCERTRVARDKAYAKAGLKRDFAMSSGWDNRVQQACR